MASSKETNHVFPTAPLEEEKLVRHMSYDALRRLSQLLRPHHELGNNYTALAGQLGFTFEEITDLREERDPVQVMLNKPELRDLTISRLKSCLMAIDRLDAVQELETFEEQTLYPSEYRQRQVERHGRTNDHQFTVLSNDEKYDAFICYARQDIEFAKEILIRLESKPYHLRLCIDYRDILPGGGNLSTVAHIIEERCQKIVVILSEFFNNDETADFQAKIALSLSPGCKKKRLIPIKYEQCKIPTIYRFITHLDYTNENAREYLWPNLARALGYTPRTKSGIHCLQKLSPAVLNVLVRAKHTLPDLPYDYDALEPTINTDIMRLHHSKHHQTYVNNLNVAEEKYAEAQAKGDLDSAIALQPALKFNGGGHLNHTIFWTNLSPNGGGEPTGDLMEAIKRDFGSFENFKERFNAATIAVQGSGWGWLGYDKVNKRLAISTCLNQDPLQATTGHIPLLGIDVWEHAYYLQYKNVRPDYVKAIYDVINWTNVADRYQAAAT